MEERTVKFKINRAATQSELLMNNQLLRNLMKEQITQVLSVAEAEFFQKFGVQGKFEIIEITTDRRSARLRATNKQTSAILKNNPGWLAQFIDNIQL